MKATDLHGETDRPLMKLSQEQKQEIENKKKGIITTDRSSKIQRWQDIIAQEEDEDDNLENLVSLVAYSTID